MAPTLLHILEQRAAERPDDLAYAFLQPARAAARELTYGALQRRARSLAARLEPARPGGERERVLLLLPAGLEVPVAFFGCLASGAIAVPAPPPEASHLRRALPRLRAIVRDCGARWVVATRAIRRAVVGLGEQLPDELQRHR